ncbi:MAG: hypothetical protein HKN20_12340, partial [Gemmatimonadetes bacterium]|nr:hypothetical protein [Gemmatimonadota bacterium]
IENAPAGRPVEIVLQFESDEAAVGADLYLRAAGERSFRAVPLEQRGGLFRVTLPGETAQAPGFAYYLLVRTESGEEYTSPARGPASNPHWISVAGAPGASRLVVLTPEPNGTVPPVAGTMISVLFDPPLADGESLAVRIDGKAIDPAARADAFDRTPDYVLVTLATPLAEGRHHVSVEVLEAGAVVDQRQWSFRAGDPDDAPARSPLSLRGRVEAGWAYVADRDVEGDPFLPFDETSSVRFDAYAYGDWSGGTVSLSASRDPIYDSEVRATARVRTDRWELEGGDIFPSLSELTAAWLSGDGGRVRFEAGDWSNHLFAARTVPADTTGGFGIFAQYVAGNRLEFRRSRWIAALNTSYGWENEASVPESLRFLDPLENLVTTLSIGIPIRGRIRLDLEAGRSYTTGNDTTEAGGGRAVLTLLDGIDRNLDLEFHSYDPGYYSLGNPTLDGGEYGFLVDASFRIAGWFRPSFKAEIYRDRESAQEIRDGAGIVQIYGRADAVWNAWKLAWNLYGLGRYYEIPYVSDAYVSRYGAGGLYAQKGDVRASLNTSVSRTKSSSDSESWSLSGTLQGTVRKHFMWEAGRRFSRTKTEGIDPLDESPTGDAATTSELSDQDRWTTNAEISVRLGPWETRAEYERVREEDPAADESYSQDLVSWVLGYRF